MPVISTQRDLEREVGLYEVSDQQFMVDYDNLFRVMSEMMSRIENLETRLSQYESV